MRSTRPPWFARRLLAAIVPQRYRAEVEGDLEEGFLLRCERTGRVRARLWYWRQLLSTDSLRFRRAARPPVLRPSPPERRNTMILDGLRVDLMYALRGLRRRRVFTLAIIATLALGIGLSTAVFTAVNAVLLRPLPYPDGDELVMVFRTVPRFGFERSVASYPDFVDWRDRASTVADMAAYGYAETTWFGDDGAEKWTGRRVTRNLLPLLGVEPQLGRGFTAEEDRPGGAPAIILSHGLWLSRFGGDAGVLGTTLRFNDEDRTVVGVMPAGFEFPGPETAFWTPLRGDNARMERDTNFLQVIARLDNGATAADAQTEIAALAAAIDASAPDANRDYGIFVESRRAFVVHGVRRALLVFAGSVALVLIIACVNVANLMLVRATTRRGEIAVRAALGAGNGRVLRLLLTESAVLGALGVCLGLGLAEVLLRLTLAYGAGQLPRAGEVSLDASALGFGIALSILCCLVFGAAPAWVGAPASGMAAARLSGDSVASRGGRAAQHALVTLQVALALVLAVSAALLLNSFARLTAVNPGFDPRGVVAGRVALPRAPEPAMENMSEEQMMAMMRDQLLARDAFVSTLLAQASALPRVEATGAGYALPLGQGGFSRTMIPEGGETGEKESPGIAGNVVQGDYFVAMGMPLVAGRAFGPDDRFDTQPVMMVNEALAATFWPGADPVGKRVRLGGPDNPWVTVIGVVADVRDESLDAEPQPRYYRSLSQVGWPDALFVVVRSGDDAEATIAGLRRIVTRLDPRLPLTDVTTMASLIDSDLAAPRLRTLVLILFGTLATVLALVGAYGVVSFVVANRRRELGVRMAIGASGRDLVRMVLARELRSVLAGVLVGLGGAMATARLLGGLLYDVAPFDPLTYAVVATLMVVAVAAACYLPARRAARIAPNEVLHAE